MNTPIAKSVLIVYVGYVESITLGDIKMDTNGMERIIDTAITVFGVVAVTMGVSCITIPLAILATISITQ